MSSARNLAILAMRRLSVGQKVTISISIPVIIGLAVIILLSARQQALDMKRLFDRAQIEITELMALEMSAAVKFKQVTMIEAVFTRQARSEHSSLATLQVLDDHGQRVAEFASQTLPHFALAAPENVNGTTVADADSHLVVAVPVLYGSNNARVGTVAIAWSRAGIDSDIAASVWQVVAVAAVILLLLGLLTFLLHRLVGRPLTGLKGCMSKLASGEHDIAIPETLRHDEIGEMARSVQVFKEHAIEIALLEEKKLAAQRAEEEKRRKTWALADDFEKSFMQAVDGFSKWANDMKGAADAISAAEVDAAAVLTDLSTAAGQASLNVQTVAGADEELSGSIAEIGGQAQKSTEIAKRAAEDAGRTNQTIEGLSDAAQKIGAVVHLIQDIAAQTNLLALNATIEAARAGEAGKGFAVVAGEVKTLAGQTARATDDISTQVAAIRSEVQAAVAAIKGIGTTIAEVNEIATSISAAVEEQSAATREIARNIDQAASGVDRVAGTLGEIRVVASDNKDKSEGVSRMALDLAGRAAEMREQAGKFVGIIRSV